MSFHAKAAIALVVLGALAIGAAKFAMPWFQDSMQARTSDAKATKGRVAIGVDNWIGYFPICSPQMKERVRAEGYLLECIDDGADVDGRLSRLAAGELDFAVATVDSYVLVGAAHDYPGTIVAVIDESKGGDALLAWESRAATLDDFKAAGSLKIAFTPNSPSDHLLKSLSVHFDIGPLRERNSWPIEVQGSEEALSALLDKRADAAVLWEPDVSRALTQPGIVRVLGTEDTQELIVDVLIAQRRFAHDKPDVTQSVLKAYFETLRFYRENPRDLIADVSARTKLDKAQVEPLLGGVDWATLDDNIKRWFGTNTAAAARPALISTLESTVEILIDYGTLTRSPLPNGDPYRLTNRSVIETLATQMASDAVEATDGQASEFVALSDAQWSALRPVGTLKMRPIVFASGTAQLTDESKRQLDGAFENLKHYPNFRVSIDGHTGLRGDADVNERLSHERAVAVAEYLVETHAVQNERLHARGFGGSKPLRREPGESSRAYAYRLPRVELVLVSGVY